MSNWGVAGSLSCAGDGDEPPPPKLVSVSFHCQKLVITITCVSGAGRVGSLASFLEPGVLLGVVAGAF